jgi:SAM-dependent methyltransferase
VFEDHFAGEVAASYDNTLGTMGSPEVLGPTVDLLAGLVGDGAALELAIGTGRVALPLAARGVPVSGIELSPDMVAQLRLRPGGDAIPVTIGDMTTTRIDGSFGLVYLVYNTIGNLLTQDDQVRCFENAARHLADDGLFVLECRVPTAPTRPTRQFVDPEEIATDHVTLGVCSYDPVTQILDENHVHIGREGIVFGPIRLRLANPPEFDLMARIAGLRLRDRWAGWNEEPFTADSWRHVSVYERAAGS